MHRRITTTMAALASAVALLLSTTPPPAQSAIHAPPTSRLTTEKDETDADTTEPLNSNINAVTPLVIVFDTSASMSETDDTGAVKMDTAKSVMNNLLADGRMKSALWTYPGGDNINNCKPGNWVPGSSWDDDVNATQVSADIRQLVPNGDTPTGPALLQVAESIGKGTDAEIILVSDGESNCGPPPCDVAKQLVADGYRIRVQPIGFDLGDQPANELQCVADITGGTYHEAADSEALEKFIEEWQVEPIKLEVNVPNKIPKNNTLTVTATVRNMMPERAITGARVNFSFEDPDGVTAQRYTPLTQPLPVLQPGDEHRAKWQISLADKPGTLDWTVQAGADGVTAQIAQGQIEVTDRALSTEDAGEILKSIEGEIAVLGDSYSSGEGTRVGAKYDTIFQVPYACHRSTENIYPTHLFNSNATIENLACSGATTEAIRSKQILPQSATFTVVKSQLKQLNDLDDLQAVFLTIGGNDIGFGDVATECLKPWTSCDLTTKEGNKVEGSATWRAYALLPALYYPPERKAERIKLEERGTQTAGLLPEAYRLVDEQVNAERRRNDQDPIPIFVSAYPYPLHLPRSGPCGPDMSDGEVRQMWDLTQRLNRTISDAVTYSRNDLGLPVHFVDSIETMALPGHSMCASDEDSYFVKVSFLGGVGKKLKDWAFNRQETQELLHPNESGHRKWATEIAIWSQGYSVPTPTTSAVPAESRTKRFLNQPVTLRSTDITSTAEEISEEGPVVDKDAHRYVANGETVTITIEGLEPGDEVRIYINSTMRRLGSTFVAEGEGEAVLGTVLPTNLASGHHTIEAWVDCADGTQKAVTIPVTVYSAPPLWLLLIIGATVLLGLLGLGFLLTSNRKLRRLREAHK